MLIMTNDQHSLQTYVSDMLALERHIAIPFANQLKDDDFQTGEAAEIVRRLHALSEEHISNLETCLRDIGGHAASPVKDAVSQMMGEAASAIDMVRKTKVSKALRDDYTALALCTAGYTMLQTTAIALSNDRVASLAHTHLRDYAQCVMEIGQALPAITLDELRDIGLSVDPSMAEPAKQAAEGAWRGASATTSH